MCLPMRRTTPEVGTRATGGGVLFIDDDPLIVKAVPNFLEQEGFQVAVATSGMAGPDLARSAPPTLFLLDIIMPGHDARHGWV